jgi:leucyl-tRNA synthetase
LEVFTTRADTIYGATFLTIAPENKLVEKLVTSAYQKKVNSYIKKAATKTELQRKDLQKNKTGVFTGSYAINPFNNEKIPIYVADYVLNSYATGIIMGVPGHDQRDYDFATKYDLPIKFVIQPKKEHQAYEGDGNHINSPLINGELIQPAIEKVINYLHEHQLGKSYVTYKMKD